ncbi:MAG: amidohydrolase family protein [Pseudomonadota bacterium]
MAPIRLSARYPDPSLPQVLIPPLACDCHAQVLGPSDRFAYVARAAYIPADAPKEVLFLRHALLGFDRGVLVQSSYHGADNGALLEAIAAGGGAYRGVAILDPRGDAQCLDRLEAAGVVGIRLDFSGRLHGRLNDEDRDAMFNAATLRGWHLEIDATPQDFGALDALLGGFQGRVLLNRIGGVLPEDEAGRRALCNLLARTPRLWVKLNGAAGPAARGPDDAQIVPLLRAVLEVAGERCVWGTGWPHAGLEGPGPDEGRLIDHLSTACPNPTVLRQVLVDNPGRLYWPEQS